MKIVFTGGGTMGPVVPLLAVAQNLRKRLAGKEQEFLWLGTKKGPEKVLVQEYNIIFKSIFHGKLRRYFCLRNFIDPIFIFFGFVQSFFILLKFKPNIIISAGGFVSVPVIWAGWLLGIPSLIHQQDIRPGLANKLTAPFAQKITVTFEKSLADFSKNKVIWTGNPVREEILTGSRERAISMFNLEIGLPTVLILGGGTGALELNKIIIQAVPELTQFCQVIHLTGRGKMLAIENSRYHVYEFLTQELKDAYAIANLVITRAGLSTLTELAVLGKPVVIVPLPESHQEDNAKYFLEKNAAMILNQKELSAEKFVGFVETLLNDSNKLKELSENIRQLMPLNAAERIGEEILRIV